MKEILIQFELQRCKYIIPMYEVFIEPESINIVMQKAEFGSLADYLKNSQSALIEMKI